MNERAQLLRTGLPAGAVSMTETCPLDEGWSLMATGPTRAPTPDSLPDVGWRPASVPGTVAAAIGPAHLDRHEDYDASDWWYRCSVPDPRADGASPSRVRLRFDGLATLVEAWLNGTKILDSSNMFLAWIVDVTDLVEPENDLVIAFRSLGAALAERRPRPRWKTKLVEHQQLRWFRTTLLGRMPGWTPAIRPVGPWRPVWLEVVSGVDVTTLDLAASLEGEHGRLTLDADIARVDDAVDVTSARVLLDGHELDTDVQADGDGWKLHCEGHLERPRLWWPATHGSPASYACRLELETTDGGVSIDLGRVGFRSVRVDRSAGEALLLVNEVPIFCRGACWTTNDIVSLVGPEAEMRRTLELAARANANMVRVGGTMVYETDAFYRVCDELGILVWQDFMFANMDYPVDDSTFARSVEAEAGQQLRRLGCHPSVVTFCGGSEVEQQAAMFGAPGELWTNDYFSRTLPSLVERVSPGTPYWPSTPTGGALPFHLGEGLAHYFGVGAYKRPLEDARTAAVKFTPECLGFANVPEPANLRQLSDGEVPPHHPAWKAGVPRDTGAGWDFDDIRDHYLERIHGIDAVELRGHDPDRYLKLSRTVTGRVMARVFDEWRSPDHPCSGGLVWFLRDLRPGAGWGIIDSGNRPKAVYYHLRRAWSPVRLALLDRGLDGLRIELHNEGRAPIAGDLDVVCFDTASVVTARGSCPIAAPALGTGVLDVEGVLGHFADPNYAYRFGPRRHVAVVAIATLSETAEPLVSVHWPDEGHELPEAELDARQDGSADNYTLRLGSARLVRDVRIEHDGWSPADNYFDLVPERPRTVGVVGEPYQRAKRGFVEATNARASVRVAEPT